MQRHLTEKQKTKGLRFIKSSREYITVCYSSILRLQRFDKELSGGVTNTLKDQITYMRTDLKETKEHLAKLERKYL
jgi:hypothetical protein